MYIYTCYGKGGYSCPKELIKKIDSLGIKNVCLLDENGIAIQPFLKECLKRNIKVSIGIKIEAYIEGNEIKQSGYFITSNKDSLSDIIMLKKKLDEDYIPYIKKEELRCFKNKDIFIFKKINESKFYNIDNEKIIIEPVYFKDDEDKNKYNKFFKETEKLCINDVRNCNLFLNKINKSVSEFIKKEYNENNFEKEFLHKIDIGKYSKIEKHRMKMEYMSLREENQLEIIKYLVEAKKNKIKFKIIDDMKESILLYSLGIIRKKPKKDEYKFKFNEKNEFKIIIEEEQKKEFFEMINKLGKAKYSININEIDNQKSIEKSELILGNFSEYKKRIKKEQKIEDFIEENKLRLLINKKEKEIFEMAEIISKNKKDECKIVDDYIVFLPKQIYFYFDDQKIYLDINEIDDFNIPYIKTIKPKNKLLS